MREIGSARFVVSIDLEMSWGAVHHGAPHDDSPYREEREIVADVLDAMSRHGISATWAVVGHLFLDACGDGDGDAHPEIVRPDYPWLSDDWYALDPESNRHDNPTWYGPDLVEAIRACEVPQEIGSHSFGHLIAGDPGCSAAAFRSDLEAAKQLGGDLRSFVYPRNSIGHLDVLAEQGFTAYRGPMPARFENLAGWRRRLATNVDRFFPLSSAAVQPTRHGDLVDVPQTYLFDPASTTARRLGTAAWARLVRRRLRYAVRTGSLCHLWFHTHNFSGHRPRAREAMDVVFAEARRHIDAGRLANQTMGTVAAELMAAESERR